MTDEHKSTGTSARIMEDLEIADKRGLKWLEAYALPIKNCDHPENRQTVIEFNAVNGGEFGTRVRIVQCLRCRTIKSGDAPWPDLKT